MGQVSTQYKKSYATNIISDLSYSIGRLNDHIERDDFYELELLITSLINKIEYSVIKKLDRFIRKLLIKHDIEIRKDEDISMYETYILDDETLLRMLQISLTHIRYNSY